MADPSFIPLRPIPLKERSSIVFLEYGQLDVVDGAFVLIDQNGIRSPISPFSTVTELGFGTAGLAMICALIILLPKAIVGLLPGRQAPFANL